jgi:hypothetical protein
MSAVGVKRRGDGEPQRKVLHAKIVEQMPLELIDEMESIDIIEYTRETRANEDSFCISDNRYPILLAKIFSV